MSSKFVNLSFKNIVSLLQPQNSNATVLVWPLLNILQRGYIFSFDDIRNRFQTLKFDYYLWIAFSSPHQYVVCEANSKVKYKFHET